VSPIDAWRCLLGGAVGARCCSVSARLGATPGLGAEAASRIAARADLVSCISTNQLLHRLSSCPTSYEHVSALSNDLGCYLATCLHVGASCWLGQGQFG
jgi:hypothetical protein